MVASAGLLVFGVIEFRVGGTSDGVALDDGDVKHEGREGTARTDSKGVLGDWLGRLIDVESAGTVSSGH